MNILLGVTGSVAAIKLPQLFDGLSPMGEVKVVATTSAIKIIKRTKHYHLGNLGFWELDEDGLLGRKVCDILSEEDEWKWESIGDPVLHIDLKDWADVLVVAPLGANTLAKMANGLCDNLLTCIYRAWLMNKPIVVAPAMNTDMWEHPVTHEHLGVLHTRHDRSRPMTQNNPRIDAQNFAIVNPAKKQLACGTTGVGAMADIKDIVEAVKVLYDKTEEEKEIKT